MSLSGRRVVNTRAAHQAEALNMLLRDRGVVPVAYPCIAIAPPADCAPLDHSLAALNAGRFAWLVLTSTNTVRAVVDRLAATGLALDTARFRCAAVGPATAQEAISALGIASVDVPEEFEGGALGAALQVQPGDRVLLPESAIARPALAHILTQRGAQVTVVSAYETVCADQGGENVPALAADGQVDAITFTSSSTVSCFVKRYEREGGRMTYLREVCVVCIGEKTAVTARESGFAAPVVAAESTLEGVVAALELTLS